MLSLIKRILTDESGASAAEYAVLTGLVIIAIVAGITYYAGQLGLLFSDLGGYFSQLAPQVL